MKPTLALFLVTAGLLACGTSAAAADAPAAPEKAPKQCFWTQRVTNFASDDDRIVNVRVGVKEVWQLEMLGRCTDVDWTTRIAIRSRGSSHICTGLDAEVIAPSPIGPQRCAVKSVRKLSKAEIKALPKRARP